MERFRIGHAAGLETGALLERCLNALGPLPADAGLGFVYATDSLAPEFSAILGTLKASTGIETWIGTVGMGICAGDREYYDVPALALMVAGFPPGAFRLLDGRQPPPPVSATRVALVHGDPRAAGLLQAIAELPGQLGDGFLVGGLSSSRGEYVHIAGEPTQAPLSGVLFDASVTVATGLSQGCSPVGPVRTLEACQGNIAMRIDGRPALDVLKEDIGEILARDLQRAAGYIFVGLPVLGSDTGDYLVRNLIGVDPTHGLIAVGDQLQPGQPLMFCRRDGQSAVADLQRMVADVRRRLPGPPRGAVYVSCLGRGRSLFGDNSEELRQVQAGLGDVPLVGFYANGEIAGDRLYGYTGVLTLFA